jgi:hypothetical protein
LSAYDCSLKNELPDCADHIIPNCDDRVVVYRHSAAHTLRTHSQSITEAMPPGISLRELCVGLRGDGKRKFCGQFLGERLK